MTWLRFGAVLFSFDSRIFTLLFMTGSLIVAAFFSMTALCIDHFLPQRIADIFYPITTKMMCSLSLLTIFSLIDVLFYSILFNLFQMEESIAFIYAPFTAFACFTIAFILGIIYKDPHWIVLNHTTFSRQEVWIREGDTIRFTNPVSGVTQRLCLDPECWPQRLRGPDAIIAPGKTLHSLFPHVGDYRVMSVENPAMVLRVHVSEEPPWHEPGI